MSLILLMIGKLTLVFAHSTADPATLNFQLNLGSTHQPLQPAIDNLSKYKTKSAASKKTGNIVWKGYLLADLIDDRMASLPSEIKSQIDLVLLKGADHRTLALPRAMVQRYEVFIGFSNNEITALIRETPRGPAGDIRVPIQATSLKGVTGIELTSVRDRYPTALLKRRTDPSAMRGEKIYVHSCLGCHGAGMGGDSVKIAEVLRSKEALFDEHPITHGFINPTSAELRALHTYFHEWKLQN